MKRYQVFGDESINDEYIVVGFVVFDICNSLIIKQKIREVKSKFGLSKDIKLHCREFFSGQRRKKLNINLGVDDVFKFYGELVNTLKPYVKFSYSYGEAERLNIPAEDDFPEIGCESKTMVSLLIMALIRPCFELYGGQNIKLWFDPDKTKILWLDGKKKQAKNTWFGFQDMGGFCAEYKAEMATEHEADFIGLADCVAYLALRKLSFLDTKEAYKYNKIFQKLNASNVKMFRTDV